MALRATKRGAERTDLSGSRDLLVCGASFAGLMVAREFTGSGADVLVIDRYEIGERQTSACAVPTDWLLNLGLGDAEKQRFDSLLVHSAYGTAEIRIPWQFSTFDYREVCGILWDGCDAEFETAKVNGRSETRGEDDEPGAIAVDTDRGRISSPLVVDALGWKRVLADGSLFQPPEGPLSRGLEMHPAGGRRDLEVWIDRKYVPAGYGWSFPAGDEVRVGVGSFDPRFNVRPTTDLLAEDLRVGTSAYQGNYIPHQLRTATEGGVFFAGDSAGHCLPLTAEGIRPALYFGAALGRELRDVYDGRQSREQALENYSNFNERHRRKFDWLLKTQKIVPKIPRRLVKPIMKFVGLGPVARWSFNKYLDIAPPEFAAVIERLRPKSPATEREKTAA